MQRRAYVLRNTHLNGMGETMYWPFSATQPQSARYTPMNIRNTILANVNMMLEVDKIRLSLTS